MLAEIPFELADNTDSVNATSVLQLPVPVPSTTLLGVMNLDILLNYILFFLLFFIIVLFIVLYIEMKNPTNPLYADLENQSYDETQLIDRQKRRDAISRAIHSI